MDPITIAAVFESTVLATRLVEFFRVVDRLGPKVDKLLQTDFNAGMRALHQAQSATTEQETLLREARASFNRAIDTEAGHRKATALFGLALCHRELGEHQLCFQAMDEIMLIEPISSKDLGLAPVRNALDASVQAGRTAIDASFQAGKSAVSAPVETAKSALDASVQAGRTAIDASFQAGKSVVAAPVETVKSALAAPVTAIYSFFSAPKEVARSAYEAGSAAANKISGALSETGRREFVRRLTLDAVALNPDTKKLISLQDSVSTYRGKTIPWVERLAVN